MKRLRVLDLFSGLGGFSQAFVDWGHYVVRVDYLAKFKPTVVADLMDNPIRPDGWDVILASPPCTSFSTMSMAHHWTTRGSVKYPKTDQAKKHLELAKRTIHYLRRGDAAFWYMENPNAMMRKVIGPPTRTVTYCGFDSPFMKKTDLWGRHAPMAWPKRCKNENPRCDHVRAPAGSRTGVQGDLSAEERAVVPYGLSLAICRAVETALAY